MSRPPVDETASSAFVREMKAALQQRSACCSPADRRQADEQMLQIMRKHLGPAALRAAAERPVRAPSVLRRKARAGARGWSSVHDLVDRKLAGAGPDTD